MNARWITMAMFLLATAAPAAAGALDECQTAGDHAAVSRVPARSRRAGAGELAQRGSCCRHARPGDRQRHRPPRRQAALAKTLRTFADYRTTQCDYVRALYASGGGAEQAQLACRVDLTRRRVRELQP